MIVMIVVMIVVMIIVVIVIVIIIVSDRPLLFWTKLIRGWEEDEISAERERE